MKTQSSKLPYQNIVYVTLECDDDTSTGIFPYSEKPCLSSVQNVFYMCYISQ